MNITYTTRHCCRPFVSLCVTDVQITCPYHITSFTAVAWEGPAIEGFKRWPVGSEFILGPKQYQLSHQYYTDHVLLLSGTTLAMLCCCFPSDKIQKWPVWVHMKSFNTFQLINVGVWLCPRLNCWTVEFYSPALHSPARLRWRWRHSYCLCFSSGTLWTVWSRAPHCACCGWTGLPQTWYQWGNGQREWSIFSMTNTW